MNDKQYSDPVPDTWTIIWRLTLALPLLLWCMGFLFSLSDGCSTSQAIPKATAYTLSGLVGWLVYLFISRPTRWSFGVIFVGLNFPMILNLQMLNPTKTPWTFPEMLANGLIRTALCMALVGLVGRLLGREKSTHASGAHPRTNAEVELPLSGVERHEPPDITYQEGDTPKATNG